MSGTRKTNKKKEEGNKSIDKNGKRMTPEEIENMFRKSESEQKRARWHQNSVYCFKFLIVCAIIIYILFLITPESEGIWSFIATIIGLAQFFCIIAYFATKPVKKK